MTSSRTKDSKPSWIESALQGLAYWMGYRKELYRHHPLPEGALVAELSSIMYGRLSENERLECEYAYANAIQSDDSTRVDIAILGDGFPHTFIEVKRGTAGKRLIEQDLLKLAKVKVKHPSIRCYLLIGSQGHLPANYVDPKTGKAYRGRFLTLEDVTYRVVRVCKASGSFERKKTAMYSCLLEVC